MYKIFDIHTHVYPEKISAKAVENLGQFYNFTVDGKGTLADIEVHAENKGVGGFLTFAVATNAHQVEKVNSFIAETVKLARSHGFEAFGFAGMHQDFPDFAAELDRIRSLGLGGVKIHPDIQGVDIDDRRLLPLYSLCEGELPIYFHMGDDRPEYRFSEAKKLVGIMKMFPRLEVVAAHLGGYRAWDESRMLAGMDNIWFDTSSALWAMTPERAKELIDMLGYERVMFGTDYPVKLPAEELERFFKIDLDEKQREDILYNNAKRFLKF